MQRIEVQVRGHIDVEWSTWLAGLAVTHTAGGDSILRGQVPDQPALHGLLNRLSDLGLQITSLTCESTGARTGEEADDM